MKVITGIYIFYFLILLQEAFNIACTVFFYHNRVAEEQLKWSLLITGLYFSSGILYFFPSFYTSIVVGLANQFWPSVVNIFIIVLDGLRQETVEITIHLQIVVNVFIDIFKYAIGFALLGFVSQDNYYNLSI